jgi:hypothetical protein
MLITGEILTKETLPAYTKAVVREHGISNNELARRVGELPSAISHALSSRGPLRLGVCRKILETLTGGRVERVVLYRVTEASDEDSRT